MSSTTDDFNSYVETIKNSMNGLVDCTNVLIDEANQLRSIEAMLKVNMALDRPLGAVMLYDESISIERNLITLLTRLVDAQKPAAKQSTKQDLPSCPHCKSTSFSVDFTDAKCKNCNTKFTAPKISIFTQMQLLEQSLSKEPCRDLIVTLKVSEVFAMVKLIRILTESMKRGSATMRDMIELEAD